jgi:hypothetical protein
MRRIVRAVVFVIAALLWWAAPASAQMAHSFQGGAGIFFPRGLDSRSDGDVLARNLIGEPLPDYPSLTDALAFDIGDFQSGHVFGEWNLSWGDRIEVGAGVGFYSDTVPTLYVDLVDPNELDIEQRIQLRIIPITGIVRFLPFGTAADIQPYVGAGLAALNYHYSERGEFVDPETLDIFSQDYSKNGVTLGTVILGGVRFPLGGDVFGLGVEGRYQFGTGDTGGADEGFVADKIDLSGGQLNFSFIVRF